MKVPRFSITALRYAGLAPFGPNHILARLEDHRLVPPGFPLLQKGARPEPSRSPFMDEGRLAEILAAPEKPPEEGSAAGGPGGARGKKPGGAPRPGGEEVRFVVAGQQAGLLGGPLYSFLKAVTIIRLAADLEKTTGVRHAPLFWIASEDHDLVEVNRCHLGGRRFVAGGPQDAGNRLQTAGVSLGDHREALLDFLREVFPQEEEKHRTVLDLVAAASFENYASHFRSLMAAVFGDRSPVFVEPAALRPLTAPVLAALVEKWPDVLSAFEAGGTVLRRHGFEPPLGEPGFFEIAGGRRVKVPVDRGGAVLSEGRCSLAEAAARIRREPDRFSPNAALRPVLQDAVIPASAFVAGPAELLYLWQIDALYAVAAVRRSPLRPRISATFLDGPARRAARRLGLAGPRLFDIPEILRRYASPKGGEDDFAEGVRAGGEALLAALDGFLAERRDKGVERRRKTIEGQVEKTLARIREIRAEEAGRGRRNLETVARAIFPGGKLQERMAGILEFSGRYGGAFVDLALAELDPWRIAHFLVEIDPGPGPAGAGEKKQTGGTTP